MKAILKPSLLKIVVTVVLLAVSSWLWRMFIMSTISDTFPLGFPLQFFLSWGPCQAGEKCSEFNGLWLVLDILIWYVISAFVVKKTVRRNEK